jgi:hypothetical protein
MRLGKITISNKWKLESRNDPLFGLTEEWYYKKCCYDNGLHHNIMIVLYRDYWLLQLDNLKAEYDLMYGSGARYWFSDFHAAQDHVDSFLIKLEKLIAFL